MLTLNIFTLCSGISLLISSIRLFETKKQKSKKKQSKKSTLSKEVYTPNLTRNGGNIIDKRLSVVHPLIYNKYFFVDYAGYISAICSATNETGNEYIVKKLKTKTDEYKIMQTIRSDNPNIKNSYLDTLQSSSIPLKVSKVFDTNNGTSFFYTFRGSKIDIAISLNFKSNNKLELSINSRKK